MVTTCTICCNIKKLWILPPSVFWPVCFVQYLHWTPSSIKWQVFIMDTLCFLWGRNAVFMYNLDHGSPNFLWHRTTPVIVVWFASLTLKSNGKLCAYLPGLLWNVIVYRVSRGECARLRENVPYVKVHRYNPKHLYAKLNVYGDNGEKSLKIWRLLHTYWLPNTY